MHVNYSVYFKNILIGWKDNKPHIFLILEIVKFSVMSYCKKDPKENCSNGLVKFYSTKENDLDQNKHKCT